MVELRSVTVLISVGMFSGICRHLWISIVFMPGTLAEATRVTQYWSSSRLTQVCCPGGDTHAQD